MNIIIVGWNVDRGAWLVSGAFTTLILLACSNTNEPIVVESREIPNADKTKAAIVELVDNGLGFGLGLEYYEVHIEKPRQKPKAHGDKGSTVIFYAEATYKNGPPAVEWIARDRLRITVDNLSSAGKKIETVDGVSIEYRTPEKPIDHKP